MCRPESEGQEAWVLVARLGAIAPSWTVSQRLPTEPARHIQEESGPRRSGTKAVLEP